jgi:hypothetical protein
LEIRKIADQLALSFPLPFPRRRTEAGGKFWDPTMKLPNAALAAVVFLSLSGLRSSAAEPAVAAKASAIETIGIYTCYDAIPPEMIPFFKACGYNAYQRWDAGWMRRPSSHARYYAEMAAELRLMKQAGFRVYVLLSVNLRQRPEGDNEKYRDDGFDPADERLMRERLSYLTTTVRSLKMADGFTVCAGDPGGHPRARPEQFLEATRKIIAMIAREAPQAEITVNTWAIAAWDHLASPFSVESWEKEVSLSRDLILRPDLLGPRVGIEFPLHNYYRSLALKLYADAGKRPELFPNAEEVRSLQQRGVKRLWGWPYFLVDECDDGYAPANGGLAQAETRYIKQTIDAARSLGLNGMTANAMAPNIFAETLNLYAFARCCKDPTATPQQIIADFAGFLSEPETAADLATVLRYIENHSTWQAGMPTAYRLPDFDVRPLKSPQDALALLAKVRLRPESVSPMSKPPAQYVLKLKDRLEMLKK